jgi:lipopolysaccharide export system permease protein
MIFERSLIRELALAALAAGGILLGISLTQAFIRLLGRAAGGNIDPETVTAVLAFGTMTTLPIVLAVSLLFAVLHVLTRSYRDSEMTVWFSSGLSIAAWIKPVLVFALPVVMLIALISLVLSPWSNLQLQEYQRRLDSRSDVSRVQPGIFTEARRADKVFFVDRLSEGRDAVNNVFVQMIHEGRIAIVVAQKAVTELDARGDTWLILTNGRRYEGSPGALDYRIVDFQRFSYRLEQRIAQAVEPSLKATSTADLLQTPTAERLAEVHWRAALPIAALLMVLVAIPLAFVNPRQGRSFNFVLAILIFAIYYNGLSTFQGLTAQGRIPTGVGLWPMHAVMVALLVGLFWKRLKPLRWFVMAR